MSKPFRRLLYALGALALLAAVAAGVLSTPWAQRAIERRIITGLEGLTGGHIQVYSFNFKPLLLQATFQGLVMRGKEPASDPPLFAARTMVVRLHLISLLRRRLLLHSLDWDDATIHVYTRPDGTTNLPEPLTSLLPELDSTDVQVERLALVRTQFYWNEQRVSLDVNAQNVAFLLRQNGSHKYSGSLSTTELRIKTHDWPFPVISLATQFELSAKDLRLKSFTWQSAGMRGDGALTLTNWTAPEGTLSLQASGEVRELARSLGLPEIRGGNIELKTQMAFRKGDYSAQGRIHAKQVSIQTPPFKVGALNVSSDFSVNSRRIDFSNLTAFALGGAAEGRAEVTFQDSAPQFSVRARLRGLALESALGSLSNLPATLTRRLASQVSGTLEAAWSGRFENFSSQFDLKMQPQRGGRAGTLPLSGLARGSATATRGFLLQIEEADFQTPHSSFSTRGSLGAGGVRLSLHLATGDYEELSPVIKFLTGATEPVPIKLNSQATFGGEISGTLTRPEVRGRLEAGSFEYRGSTWDKGEADVTAGPDHLEVTSGRLMRGKSALTVTAAMTLDNWKATSSTPLRISGHAERAPLDGLKAALGVDYPVDGFLSGHLDLRGTPANLSGTGEARIDHGALAGEPFESVSTRLRVEETTWYFENLLLEKGPGRAQGHGSINASTRALTVDLHGAGFSLASIKLLTPSRQNQRPNTLDGQIGFDLRSEGTLDHVSLQGAWNCRNVSLNETAVGDLEGKVNWKGREILLEGHSQGAAGTVSFSGTAHAEGDWPMELSGTFTSLRVEPWLRLLLGKSPDARVTASGTLRATGPLKDFARIEVRTRAESLEVNFPSLTWRNEQPVELHYANRKLTASRFRVSGPSTDLEVEGSIQFGSSASLSLTAQGKIDATILNFFDPELQAAGRADVKLRVGGSPEHPLIYGTLNVQDVTLSYADFPFRLTGLAGEVTLEGDRATVRSLRGTSGGGSVALSGFVTFADSLRFNLQAVLTQVRVRYPIDFTSVLEGNLHLTGSSERAQIAGELMVRQMSPGEGFNWLARLGEAAATTGVKPPALASPFAPRVRLDIQVSSSQGVRFETHDLRLLADIDVHLQGTLANPVQVGTIQITSGEVVLRGNRYKLDHGYINFTNPYRTQAVLDVEARTRVQRYDLTVNVSGPLERVKVSYRSDPPLPTTDIVSLLAFGYASQQEEMATRTNQPVQSVGASALLSQALSTQVSGRIQRLFGVSRIKVDPNLGGLGYTAGGARVTVEQQMTRDLTLTYVTLTSTSQQRIIQFEWNLSDRISLVGLRDHDGIFGMELKFRQRFK